MLFDIKYFDIKSQVLTVFGLLYINTILICIIILYYVCISLCIYLGEIELVSCDKKGITVFSKTDTSASPIWRHSFSPGYSKKSCMIALGH